MGLPIASPRIYLVARALSFTFYSLPVALSLAVVGVGLAVAAADGVVLLGADAASVGITVVAADATFGAVDTEAYRRQQNETQENDVFHFQREDSIVSADERN